MKSVKKEQTCYWLSAFNCPSGEKTDNNWNDREELNCVFKSLRGTNKIFGILMSLPVSWIKSFFYPNLSGRPVLLSNLENLVLGVAEVSPLVFGLYNSLRSDRVVPAVNGTVVTCTYRLKADCKGEKLQCHKLWAFTIWKKGRVLGSVAFHVVCLLWTPSTAAAIHGHYKWNRKPEKKCSVWCWGLRSQAWEKRSSQLGLRSHLGGHTRRTRGLC